MTRPTNATCYVALGFVLACPVARPADVPSPATDAAVDTIVVSGQKLSVETRIDRKIYSVTSDLQSTFGSLSDVLTLIPSVEVDGDGLVSLRGDSNVLILIDGKPSAQFSGASAGDALQSIPAKDIERIEVLTNPPAQFKADGAAGVINIILRKKRSEGLTGTLQGSRGSSGRSVVGANGAYSSGPLTASVNAGYRQDYRHRLVQSDVVAADPATGLKTDTKDSIDERIRRATPTVGLAVEYALNDRQSISGSASWADRGGLRTYTQLDDRTAPSGGFTSSTRRLSAGHDPEIDMDQKLGFTQKLGQPGETLDFSVHRTTSLQHEHYDYTNDSFVPPAPTFYSNLSFREAHTTNEFGADYALPLSKMSSLKAGYAFERDDYKFGNLGGTVDPVTGAQTIDPNQTNDFKVRQQINALYASYQVSHGAWNGLGGLRAEFTRWNAQQLTDNISNTVSYFEIYPSLHVDYSVSDESTLSFGASRRVTRPQFEYLNPYINYEYTPNLTSGNADLRPQFTQSFEAGYGFEGRTQAYALTGYYRRNRDSVTDITEYLANGVTLTTKTNLPKDDSAGLEFTADGHIVPKLAYSLSGNLFRSQIDATALGISGLQSTTGVNAKVKLDYRPTTNDSAQITLTRSDKRLTPQGFVSAVNLVNLGYKRQVRPDLTALMTVTDLFNGQRFRRFTATPTFTEEYERTVVGRVFYIGLAYSFGSTRKDKQPNFEYDHD